MLVSRRARRSAIVLAALSLLAGALPAASAARAADRDTSPLAIASRTTDPTLAHEVRAIVREEVSTALPLALAGAALLIALAGTGVALKRISAPSARVLR